MPFDINIISPFPEAELPTLFCWQQRIWDSVNDDDVARSLPDWMEWQNDRRWRPGLKTFAVHFGHALGGYAEAVQCESFPQPGPIELRSFAWCSFTFKREFWKGSRPALAKVITAMFKDTGVEMLLFGGFWPDRMNTNLIASFGGSTWGKVQPRMRNGQPADAVVHSITAFQWKADHQSEFAELPSADALVAEPVGV